MPIQKHANRKHALLSASGASRWLNCPPSARLEDEYGEKSTSSYAAEGTLAHELSELYLSKNALNSIGDEEFEQRLEAIMSNDLFSEEMLDVVPIYTDYCESQLAEAKTQSRLAIMQIEQKIDLTKYVPESFGTADCVIINDDVLEVIDLKYGKGVPVYAEWNRQLMLYGLGALHKYDTMYDITSIKLTIVQPRLNNISSFLISVEDLLNWAETELKPTAALAYEGKGDLSAGEWCKFCAVRNRCRALYEQQVEIAKYEFAEPSLLSDEEIADILKRAPRLVEYASSIKEYAQAKAIKENKHWPGFKLVEGISRRKWADEEQAVQAIFKGFPELGEDDIFNMKLKSITDLEKIVGKKRFAEVLSNVIVKPQGAPTLVSIDDKRPALGEDQAKEDFK